MPSRIIFLPIEPYKSRYTQYTSVEDGVYETQFKKLGIDFLTIRPDRKLRTIQQGQVLDVGERTHWGFSQIECLVKMICAGDINPQDDVIYLEDFWTPGFEMIPYAQSSKFGPAHRDHAKVYSFCHAQSTDPYDFTAPWAWWMRPLEKMWFDYQTRVFCAAREMLSQLADGGIPITKGNSYKVIPVGHAFDRDVMLRIANAYFPCNRTKRVVWSSRWDMEKNPDFFMDLIVDTLKDRRDIIFTICTGQPKINSNNPDLLLRLRRLLSTEKIEICENLNLQEYYEILKSASVLFNCASQDFISYVLLDAAINGCAPLFPEWLTFPDALERNPKHLYKHLDLQNAKNKLYDLIDNPVDRDFSWIYSKYENSVRYMCKGMGFQV